MNALKLFAAKIIVSSNLNHESKIQLLNFVKESTKTQVKSFLLDGRISKLDEISEEIVNDRFLASSLNEQFTTFERDLWLGPIQRLFDRCRKRCGDKEGIEKKMCIVKCREARDQAVLAARKKFEEAKKKAKEMKKKAKEQYKQSKQKTKEFEKSSREGYKTSVRKLGEDSRPLEFLSRAMIFESKLDDNRKDELYNFMGNASTNQLKAFLVSKKVYKSENEIPSDVLEKFDYISERLTSGGKAAAALGTIVGTHGDCIKLCRRNVGTEDPYKFHSCLATCNKKVDLLILQARKDKKMENAKHDAIMKQIKTKNIARSEKKELKNRENQRHEAALKAIKKGREAAIRKFLY